MLRKFSGRTAGDLARSIESAVHSGALAPGEALPPIRKLASAVRLSPVTVAAAYRRLHSRGIVVGEGRRGTRVRPNPASPVVAEDERARAAPDGLLDLATGNPDADLLPFTGSVMNRLGPPRLYGEPAVHGGLKAFAAAEFAADEIDSSHVAVCSGALDAIERLLREHLRPGDRIAVEDPSVPALLDLIGASGFSAVPIGLDPEGPRPESLADALASGVRAIVLTPRAQNPTGAVLSKPRAAELARLLKRRDDLLVVENDPFGPVAGTPYVSVCGGAARWAVVRSVSKFLGPDLRVSVMAGDELTIARVQGRQSLGVRWVSHILQELVLALWSDPSSGRRLAQAADVYDARRRALVDALGRRDVRVHCRSGFNVWVPVHEEHAAVQHLAARGWSVAPGERFRIRSAPAIRIATATLPVHLAEALAGDVVAAVRPSTVHAY
jgi:DNA-binding transcriptional MocR family regulator